MQPLPAISFDTVPAEGAPFAFRDLALAARAEWLNRRWAHAPSGRILAEAIELAFKGRIAVVSSFGAEAAVLLHLVAQVDKATPILFLDTGKHFLETLTYRDILIDRFGFTDARSLEPDPADLAREDQAGDLWSKNPDRCCHLRKVIPLDTALRDFDAWVTGRKRYQTSHRTALPIAEVSDGRIKINPLATWTEAEISQAFKDFRLPRHPLFDDGFASIGCAPCTRRILEGEDSRAGRWSGREKTECGIHFGYTDGEGI
ncbi:MAG: phosphoadenylyl-sulfate reductase [Dongiaceae bacterium]